MGVGVIACFHHPGFQPLEVKGRRGDTPSQDLNAVTLYILISLWDAQESGFEHWPVFSDGYILNA